MVSNLKGQKRCKLHSSKWRAPGPWVELWKLLPKESKKAVTRYSFARLFVQCRWALRFRWACAVGVQTVTSHLHCGALASQSTK